MICYLPDSWDDSYPLLLDRYVPIPGYTWTAYEGMPVAEAALNRGDMIMVLAAYDEWTAILRLSRSTYMDKSARHRL